MRTSSIIQAGVPPVLLDPAQDAELRDQGHVVIPFLQPDEVASLYDAYVRLRDEDESGLRIDVMSPDRTLVATVAELMAPIWKRALPTVFNGYEPVSTSFIVKYQGSDSAMGLHREPTYTDAEGARAFNVWLPLVDVSAARGNGVLALVPGSDAFPAGYVGFNTPSTFRNYQDLLERHARPVEAAAGSAVIFDSRVLHCSGANVTSEPRPVVASAVAPCGAGLVTTVAAGRRRRRVHRVDHDFFISVHPYDTPAATQERYPDFREFDECVELPPEVVQAVLGLDQPPARCTVVPSGLAAGRPPGSLSECEGRTDPRVTAVTVDVPDDLVTRIRRLPAHTHLVRGTPLAGGISVTAASGDVVAVPLGRRRTRRQVGELVGTDLGRVGGTTVVVLGSGSRLVLDAPAALGVGALDCPMVEAGVLSGDSVATLEPGLVFAMAAGAVSLWNDGSSPLVAVLAARGRGRLR